MLPEDNIDETFIRSREGSGGFGVPQGYFDSAKTRILMSTSDRGFTVPENYFEGLQNRITGRAVLKRPTMQIIHTKSRWMAVGIAASLLIAGGLFLYTPPMPTHKQMAVTTEMNSLSDEEILSYVDLSDLKDQHLAGLLPKTEDAANGQIEEYILDNTDGQLITDEL